MHEFANAFVLFSNFVLIPSITYGSQLAIGALGITLVFSILRFANFAHGDTMAFGTMIAIFCTWGLQAVGFSLGPLPVALVALPVAIAVTVGLVLGTDKIIYRFYRDKKVDPIILVMASVGVMFMMNGLVRIFIGVGEVSFADGSRFIIRAREFREMTGLDEGLALRTTQVITVVVAVVVMGALFWFLQKTRTGKSLRAFSDNEDLALLSGIKPERVVQITWIIAATLATIAGVLYGLDKGFRPFTYFQLLLPMFAAAILGGIGQPIGAVVGGFVIAFSEVSLTYAYRRVFEYLGPEGFEIEGLAQLIQTEYKFAISFMLLVIVLLVRPTGIFKGRVL
ncbi:MAG: branched-chain amino acid ABC transporter permease [Alphaproteobacteria bacterium]|nr:branched-chain amino acid ABC transporter permease [Alphaproteobacteria bacterium]